MTEVVRISQDEQSALSDELDNLIVEVLEAFSEKHGISPISSSALALHCLTVGLSYLGGTSAKPYVRAVAETMFCTDPREARRINARMENYMIGMANHSDMMARQIKGGMQ